MALLRRNTDEITFICSWLWIFTPTLQTKRMCRFYDTFQSILPVVLAPRLNTLPDSQGT